MKLRKTMISVLGVAALAFASCASQGKDGLLVHIASGPGSDESNHRIIMGLNLAYNALKSGRPVLVFFDVKGVVIPVQSEPDVAHESHKEMIPSAKEAMRKILDEGGRIMVCPACLKHAGFGEGDLIEGAEMGKMDTIFNFTDGRVITLDW